MRRALRAAVEQQPTWTVCAEATTALESLAKTIEFGPEVVLLDTGLPGFDSVEFTRELRRVAPASKVLIVSVFESNGERRRRPGQRAADVIGAMGAADSAGAGGPPVAGRREVQ